ncbi:MAG: biosynthetic-type acetolactate synthase large subunit [Lachnospiraceae bacterium]|nr:biosynthetic-type acetolactate synthase large subunit [Lachnospiraceae bacterium]
MILSGADILVRVLIEQGAKTVFGYPGGQILNVYDSLYKYQDEITHILTAHEQGAVHAADGFARSTGEVGVVLATSGPGATNLVTGIATAYLDSIPLVAITGNVPTTQIGTDSFQEIDITGVTLPITKHNYFVGDVEELADVLREAFRLAKSGRPGPVLVDVPKDVQIKKCDFVEKEVVKADPTQAAKDVRIEEAAELINESERPFIYFGGGMISSGAQEEMLELAEKIDAPIGCSLMGLSGIPTDHPRFLGMQGMHGHYASSVSMHKSDLIISLGVRFNDRVTGNRAKFATSANIVHIDVDGSELSKTVNAAVGLRGNIKDTLKKLLPLIKESKKEAWQAKVKDLREEELEYLDRRDGLTPRNAILTLNKYLGANTAIATDVGQHQMWTAQNVHFVNPRRFISSGGLGTMGFGLGAAIGAAYGTGEKSVLVTGDGSFGMCLNEMATAATYNVPVVVLLINNGVLGMVRQWQTLFFDKHYSNTILDRKTNFVELSKAFGANGEDVKTLDELDAALERAFKADGPYLINCLIDKDEFVLPMLPPGGSMDEIIVKVGD